MEGQIEGNSVILGGRFDGTIQARGKVEIQTKAIVTGEIHTPCLIIEPGAVFDGRCHMLSVRSSAVRRRPITIPIRSAAAQADLSSHRNSNPQPSPLRCISRPSAPSVIIVELIPRRSHLAEAVRLTTTAKAAGCAAKLSPSMLDAVLKRLPSQSDPNVLVGFETSDDAAVYRLTDDLAIVQTVDFFTPIVDDPALFGQVAAANALSDIYAMGGRPISALTIVAFPTASAPEILEQILRGGLAKMAEANCTVVGGHSIRDDELKFGYAVTGVIHPQYIWKNVGARPGDVLLFTKPRRHGSYFHRSEARPRGGLLGRCSHCFHDAPESRCCRSASRNRK